MPEGNPRNERHPRWRERLGLKVVESLAAASGRNQVVERVLRAIAEETGLERVGLRVRQGDDYVFHVVNGPAGTFSAVEGCRCQRRAEGADSSPTGAMPPLPCLCGAVLTGERAHAPEMHSRKGSFFARNLQEQARRIELSRLREVRSQCIDAGFETLALIPLVHAGDVIGLLHLSDRRAAALESDDLEYLEGIGASVIAALEREAAAEVLHKEAERTGILLRLHEQAPALSEDELYAFVLEQVVRLTGSEIGFFHLVSDDGKSVALKTWSSRTLELCQVGGDKSRAYLIDEAGNWVDCVRLRRPVIYNDFANAPNRKGLPAGHVPVRRYMSIPVFEEGVPKIIFGVGNKVAPYDGRDVGNLQLVANELQKLVVQRRIQSALRENEQQYRAMFEKNLAVQLLVDPETGAIVDANPAACAYYGYPREKLLSLRITDIHTMPPEEVRARMKAARSEHGTAFDSRHRLAGGEVRDVAVYSGPLRRGGATLLYSIILDVTARKAAEARLREHGAALELRSRQLQALTSELTLTEQRERHRLATVLHDDLQQLLVAARFGLARLKRLEDGPANQAVDEVSGYVDQALACSRTLTAELSPPVLFEGGLVPALEWLARWMRERFQIEVTLAIAPEAVPSSPALTVLLFRAARELMLNVAKHAKTPAVEVAARRLGDDLQLVVEDRGVGFDISLLDERPATGGFGIFSIRQRLDVLGGRFEASSTPGRGSRFVVTLPLRRDPGPAAN